MAECVYVLESHYEVPRPRIAELLASALAFPAVTVLDEALLLRALAVYADTTRDFVDAYLVAGAELTGIERIVSFDRDFDEIPSIRRVAP